MKIIKQYFIRDGKNSHRAYCKIFIEYIKYMTQFALPLHSYTLWCEATAAIFYECPSINETGI